MAKQIIDGKLYDTDRATYVIKHNGHRYYRTDNGAWFYDMYGILVVRSEEQIKEVLATEIDLYIKYFGKVELA